MPVTALLTLLRRLLGAAAPAAPAAVPAEPPIPMPMPTAPPAPMPMPAPVPLTAALIAAGTGATPARAAHWREPLAHACTQAAIHTPQRLAAFLSQIGHESGRLQYVREIWGPTPAQTRYEGRAALGNTHPGDGRRYLGRGLIQITGRANYRAASEAMARLHPDAPDFEAHPELLEQPHWAALTAAWYWHDRGLNALADQDSADAYVQITRRINGGTNGLADRRALHAAARSALGLPPL